MTVEHFLFINAKIDNNFHTFINIYVPNKETNFSIRLSHSILIKIVKFEDFNCNMNKVKDKPHKKLIKLFKNKLDLVDVRFYKNPTKMA